MSTRTVVFDYRQPDMSGTDAASGGYVKVQPWPQVERSKPGYRLLPEQMMERLSAGVASIPLECSDTYTAGCWLVVSPIGDRVRYITVPAGTGTITADACPDVDPDLFTVIDPTPSVGETLTAMQAAIDALGGGTGTVTSVNTVTPDGSGDVTLTKADVGLGNVDNTPDVDKPISAAQAVVNAVKADLVAGKIPATQIPDIAITQFLGTVANQTAMLALTGQQGDWAIRSDTGLTWVITGSDPTLLASWTSLSYPGAPVTSINGQTGAVTIEALVVAAASKATPVDADVLPIVDSAASNVLKKLTWAGLKATLKTYLDTLYAAVSHSHAATAITSGTLDAARLPAATTTAQGAVELATTTETTTGTDTSRATTPAGVKAVRDALDGIMGQAFVIQGLTGARVDQRSGAALGTNCTAIWVGEGTTATNQTAGDVVIDTTAYVTTIPLLTKEVLFSYTVPSAATVFNANAASLRIANLAGFTQCRMVQIRNGLTNGQTGAKLTLKYASLATVGGSANAANYADIGTSPVENMIDGTGVTNNIVDSGWINLAAGAKAEDVVLAVIASGGNGTTSVNFQGVYLMLK